MEEIFCYHHLHSAVGGRTAVQRINNAYVLVILGKIKTLYSLQIDIEDERVLFCFDGGLPSGGLPKGSDIILRAIPPIPHHCHISRVYMPRSEYEDPPLYSIKGDIASQEIFRYFILFRTGDSCALIRKYKATTLEPEYLAVTVKDGEIHYIPTSY